MASETLTSAVVPALDVCWGNRHHLPTSAGSLGLKRGRKSGQDGIQLLGLL
ncbi:hypothetical protein CYA_0779 [Synechococcus sp. JA-3-3Ab]|nr:hypothetical protein CYA_0779 [Synechococcus sp. JA-3-3Ab]